MTSDYKPSPDEIALMDAYKAKGWTFAFESGGCHVGGWDDCIVTSHRITFEVNVDIDGFRKSLTEERLLDEEASALATKHDDAFNFQWIGMRDHVYARLCAMYRNHEPIPTTISELITLNLQ